VTDLTSNEVVRDAASYRDPAGFVYRRSGVLLRQVNRAGFEDWEKFRGSELAQELVGRDQLVAYDSVGLELRATDEAMAVIRPQEIPFVSYPYEWTFGQLQDAALLTLDIQTKALEYGWTLKDASAFNVTFGKARPIFIDSLSFEPHVDGDPWTAYGQFCRHFLAPLALMSGRDIRLGSLLQSVPDGLPLDLVSALLPIRAKADPGIASHLVLHAKAQRQGRGSQGRLSRRLSRGRLRDVVLNLRDVVAKRRWEPGHTEWANYADHNSYSDAATEDKERVFRHFLTRVTGSIGWDLGANTGRYSALMAEAGLSVTALDIDPGAAELHYRSLKSSGRRDVLPLVADIASPTPSTGWAGRERRSLTDRCDADVIAALALVHHVAIGRNVPLPQILELFADLATWAIVEFVPKDDPMVVGMLATRRDVFPNYSVGGFRAAAKDLFEIVEEVPLRSSTRVMFLLRRQQVTTIHPSA
jgi:hypothetical protein